MPDYWVSERLSQPIPDYWNPQRLVNEPAGTTGCAPLSMPLLFCGGAPLASFWGAGMAAFLGLVESATCGSLFCESVLLRGRAAGLLGFAGGAVAVAVCSVSAGGFSGCALLDENRLEKKPVCAGGLAALAGAALVDPVVLVSVEATRVLFLLNRPPKKFETVPPPVFDGLLAA